jgi:hypothetical protein
VKKGDFYMNINSKSLKTKVAVAASVAGLALNLASAMPVLASETKSSTYDINTTMGYAGPPEAAFRKWQEKPVKPVVIKGVNDNIAYYGYVDGAGYWQCYTDGYGNYIYSKG